MPTVSQHYGHHAVPGAVDETRTRQPGSSCRAHGIRRRGLDGTASYGVHIKAGYPKTDAVLPPLLASACMCCM